MHHLVDVCAYIRCVWINERRRVSNLTACRMCGKPAKRAYFHTLTQADPGFCRPFPISFQPFCFSFSIVSLFVLIFESVAVWIWPMGCLSFSSIFFLHSHLKSVHCSSPSHFDFQLQFIRVSGLAIFLQHMPLPPKLIGFHYRQG